MDCEEAQGIDTRRVILVAPVRDERMLTKALSSGADEVVLDLEDAVPALRKDAARELLVDFLAGRRRDSDATSPQVGRVAVRVNDWGDEWSAHDLEAVVALDDIDSIVVPKVERAEQLESISRALSDLETKVARRRPIRLQALIETGAGLHRLPEIAAVGGRLTTLLVGYADLAASLGRRGAEQTRQSWLPTQEAVLWAARANRLSAIDGPHLSVEADQALRDEAGWTAALGFDAKWVIHPRQLDDVRQAFTPTPDEVARARQIIDALDQAAREGSGAIRMDGHLVDEAMAREARRTLARVES